MPVVKWTAKILVRKIFDSPAASHCMRTSVAEQRAHVINVAVAQKDVLGRYGVVEAGGGAHVEDYSRTGSARCRRRRLMVVQNRILQR